MKVASECNEELRAIWEGVLAQEEYRNPDLFLFLDESSVDNHTFQRRMGWSEVNAPCVDRGVFLGGTRYSILPALSIEGIVALDIFEGSVTTDIFINFIREQVVSIGQFIVILEHTERSVTGSITSTFPSTPQCSHSQ